MPGIDWEILDQAYEHQCVHTLADAQPVDPPQPDWADILAKLWTDEIRNLYRNKGFDGTPSKPLVIKTAKELMKPVDDLFGQAISYDAPDRVMKEVLRKNIWDFSVAKNYQDNVRLNNLLLDDQGKLRGWSAFKREAQKVVGQSNRYLKTEYNTVVAGAQMSRLWQDIQRDKHLFPYAQFDVVDDGHTSDICKPLKDVIVSVDDPMLAHYFPPNHFNCRTTVRKLRKGTPTARYEVPQIPEDFKNNVGATGEVFTKGNAYLANTPKEVIEDFHRELRRAKKAEIQKWSKTNITEGGEIINGFYISRRAIRDIHQHFTSLNYKDMVKDIKKILHELELIDGKPLSPDSPNYEKKQRRGVVSYEYYRFEWRGELFRLNVEIYEDGRKQPYAINIIKEG